MICNTPARSHGGPDALGPPLWDFSTNANACGPCPQALDAVRRADVARYPDPGYRALHERLAAFHRVAPGRIVLAASASEFVFRITALAVRSGVREVQVPRHAYGDYRHAALAWNLAVIERSEAAAVDRTRPALVWACEPSSPLGEDDPAPDLAPGAIHVLDRAYAPLRLEGTGTWSAERLARAWQLFSPNKALGLTGVRGAYAIAPAVAQAEAAQLDQLAASWVLGADGVALLAAWCDTSVQQWLHHSRATLRHWKAAQVQLLQSLGWSPRPGGANFMVCRPPVPTAPLLAQLREQGIKLRDGASFGLPGCVRLGVLAPPAQDALRAAWALSSTSLPPLTPDAGHPPC